MKFQKTKKMNSEDLSSLVFTIDEKDFEHIVTVLVGKNKLKVA